MFAVDRVALASPAARFHPAEKALPALAGIGLSLAAPRPAAALGLFLFFLAVGLALSRAGLRVYLEILAAPAAFIVAGALGLAVGLASEAPVGARALHLGAIVLYASKEGYARALLLGLRALAASGALLALMLSTPANDLFRLARSLGVPAFLVELASLTYRYIALLAETAGRIRTAQECRLGYQNARRGRRSLALLVAASARIAWIRSEAAWDALRSRGYEGSLAVRGRGAPFKPARALAYTSVLGTVAAILFLGAPA